MFTTKIKFNNNFTTNSFTTMVEITLFIHAYALGCTCMRMRTVYTILNVGHVSLVLYYIGRIKEVELHAL